MRCDVKIKLGEHSRAFTVYDMYPHLYNKFAIIPHPSSAKVLLVQRGESWTLPGLRNPEYNLAYQEVAGFNAAVSNEYGIDVTTLEYFGYHETLLEEGRELDRFYAMENHSSPDRLPAGSRWFGKAEFEEVSLARTSIRPKLREWFAWCESERQGGEAPWERPGWLSDTVAGIDDMLQKRSHSRTGPVEQIVVWSRSCVLRVPIRAGSVYYKASSDALRVEAPLTAELARAFPDNSVRIFAADTIRNSLLMEDHEGTSLREILDTDRNGLATVERALVVYSTMQIEIVDRVGELLRLGVPDRRLGNLPANFEALLPKIEGYNSPTPVLTHAEIDLLLALGPAVRERCDRLAQFDIPQTIEHGDFHPGQIFLRSGSVILTDWSDGSISHPFFSLPPKFESAGFIDLSWSQPAVVRRSVIDAYLRPWRRFESPDRLLEAYDLARGLAFIHRALIFDKFVACIDARSRTRWQANIPGNLRFALGAFG